MARLIRPKGGLSKARGVDVHCHIFNSRDLPITQFVRQVLLVDYPLLGNLLEPAVAFFAYIMDSGIAPTADDEIKKLNEIHAGRTTLRAFLSHRKSNREAREKQIVREAIARLHHGDIVSSPGGKPLGVEVSVLQRRAFIEMLHRDAFSRKSSRPVSINLDRLVKRLFEPEGVDLAALVPWCLTFTHYRFEILDDLAHFSPPADREIGAYVPATVDYAYWLGEFDTTPISKQAEVMDKISSLKDAAYAMRGYIAFDPARQALLEKPDALDPVIVNAIENQQFIGVKLYPPMGFRPIGNEDLDDSSFPALLKDRLGSGIGKKLDDALMILYTWCIANEIPIMAHCGNSNYARQGYGERADPQYWREVLEYQDQRGLYPLRQLRLNLGHSGGLKAFAEGDDVSGRWLRAIIQMLANPDYSNLYSDVAFDEIALERSDDEKRENQRVKDFLKRKLKNSLAAKKLMYGSDWIMLGYQNDNSDYYNDLKECFREILGSDELLMGFLGENARRFLKT